MNPAIQTITTLFQEHGTARYGVEPVTQLEHALQSASLAEDEGASVWMVTAALLHDIGHIFEDGLLQPFDELQKFAQLAWEKNFPSPLEVCNYWAPVAPEICQWCVLSTMTAPRGM